MILNHKITVEELSKVGKNHKWERHFCEKCSCFSWGHGFVTRYFQSIEARVHLKRYRCPKCGSVTTTRPDGYWPMIRSSILTIFNMLLIKISKGFWPTACSRQRGGHWLKRFVNHAKMSSETNLEIFLVFCFQKNIRFLP
jgi:hypothetical protein